MRVYYDAVGRTLSVWIADPETEDVCEEVGDDTILMKDADGHIIGFEKLNVVLTPGGPGLTVEVVAAPSHAA
ncbi:MAG: DUF2283 domain-containing protein [Planctomycetota bacterium]